MPTVITKIDENTIQAEKTTTTTVVEKNNYTLAQLNSRRAVLVSQKNDTDAAIAEVDSLIAECVKLGVV